MGKKLHLSWQFVNEKFIYTHWIYFDTE
jgi:hypothetical protein